MTKWIRIKEPGMETEYLTLKQLCEVLGISDQTFYRNKMGEVIPAYKVGKSVKYKKADIEILRIKGTGKSY